MARPRILVVDDDPHVRAAIHAMLESDGYDVVATPDGRMAVVAATLGRFEIVLLDLKMPHPDGLATLRMLRELMPGSQYVMMTGGGSAAAGAACANAGAVAFLQKPLQLDDLSALAQRLTSGAA